MYWSHPTASAALRTRNTQNTVEPIVKRPSNNMSLPKSLIPAFENLSPEAKSSVLRDFAQRRKSKVFAYLAWFLLGWHYLYLKRVGLQIAFWITAGGFFVWWIIDLFRVSGLVDRMNEDTARKLMIDHKALSLP
jgi:hypothetical protein